MKTLRESLSKKEEQMFVMLGHGRLLDIFTPDEVIPLYRIAVETAFCDGQNGSAVESLRKCMDAIRHCKVYRDTPEFDNLIEL